jgi:uncharacterized membrane protein
MIYFANIFPLSAYILAPLHTHIYKYLYIYILSLLTLYVRKNKRHSTNLTISKVAFCFVRCENNLHVSNE